MTALSSAAESGSGALMASTMCVTNQSGVLSSWSTLSQELDHPHGMPCG
ncbi:hypothetical protein [Skermania piniformis]|uniref:Uncharacterized protein n=1 Tax=Skermania pinensis TaxID=39122 RepID=A0ABX8S4Z8_9ACTN|nr:hypothetical protein [Skermania piniformis]QXQ12924.1 hypothetical protein KV203_13500 [Skermania piniformis]